jgi:hypothetical protein
MPSETPPDKYAGLEDAILQLQGAISSMVENFDTAAVGYERTIALASKFHNVLDIERPDGPRRLVEPAMDKTDNADNAVAETQMEN